LNEKQRQTVKERRENYQQYAKYVPNEDNLALIDDWYRSLKPVNANQLLSDYVSRNSNKDIKFVSVVRTNANSFKDLLVASKNLPRESIKLYACFQIEGKVYTRSEKKYSDNPKYYNRIIDLITYEFHNCNFEAMAVGYLTERSQKNKLFRTFTRVANSIADNCVVQCIYSLKGKSLAAREQLYTSFPSLRPTGAPIYIDNEMMNDLAKYFRCKINTYSSLGAEIPDFPPWQTFGYKNDKKLDIVIGNEHATMKFLPKVDRVVLHDNISNDVCMQVNVSVLSQDEAGGPITRYIEFDTETLEVVMHKIYKTSGTDVNYAYCNSDDKYYTKLFKEKHMVDDISDVRIRNIVRKSEYFIKVRKDSKFGLKEYNSGTSDVIQCDANKCYVAYEQNPYYVGFPIGDLRVSMYTGNIFAFCVVSKYENLPECWSYFNPVTNNVLSYPLYRYLVDNGANITIDYVLGAGTSGTGFSDISIVDFSETLRDSNGYKLTSDNKKHFRNQLIGRLISGGINEKVVKRIGCGNESEYEQIIFECNTYKELFGIEYWPVIGEGLSIDVAFNYNTKGCFTFHSYILSYANIMMMEQYKIIKRLDDTVIIGHIFDAIIIRTSNEDVKSLLYSPLRNEIGGFKYEHIKQYFALLKIGEVRNEIHF
jgi:hypothetical protein